MRFSDRAAHNPLRLRPFATCVKVDLLASSHPAGSPRGGNVTCIFTYRAVRATALLEGMTMAEDTPHPSTRQDTGRRAHPPLRRLHRSSFPST